MEERSQSVLEVMELDGGLIGIEDTMDDYWEEEYHFIEKLNHYVWKWTKQIRLNKAYPRKTCFIQNTEVLAEIGVESSPIKEVSKSPLSASERT